VRDGANVALGILDGGYIRYAEREYGINLGPILLCTNGNSGLHLMAARVRQCTAVGRWG
jgi:hypothetical protein